MILDGENLSFQVNDKILGVAFNTPKFSQPLFPAVFIVDTPDIVTVL